MTPKIVSKIRCNDCNTDVTLDNSKVTAVGVFVCNPCLQNYFKCDKCGDIHENSHKITQDFEVNDVEDLCADCAEGMSSCYCCGTIVESPTVVNNHKYCRSCLEDECSPCSSCEIVTEDSVLRDNLCPTCIATINPTANPPPMCRRRYLTKRCFSIYLDFIRLNTNNSNWRLQLNGETSRLMSPLIRGADGIENIRTAVRSITAEVNRTCSYGIQIDFSSQKEEDVKKFLMVGIALQEWVTTVVPRSRSNNDNCRLFHRDLQIQLADAQLDEWLYGTTDNRLLKSSYIHPSSSSWIDIHSFYNRGMVGINIHPGTRNILKILRWAELWLKTAEWAIGQKTSVITAKFLEPDWYTTILNKIGVRRSTTQYFVNRQAELARRRSR